MGQSQTLQLFTTMALESTVEKKRNAIDAELEVCVDSVESCLIAAKAGADRLELCSALIEGGLTPTTGMIKSVVNALTKENYNGNDIELHCMIRPRSGDFNYNEFEIETILGDISSICQIKQQMMKNSNLKNNIDTDHDNDNSSHLILSGLVFGFLCPNGDINRKLIQLCQNEILKHNVTFKLTFHRAIDMSCKNKMQESLQSLFNLKIDRILTSGYCNSVNVNNQSIENIRNMIYLCQKFNNSNSNEKSKHYMYIAIGGGISNDNIKEILQKIYSVGDKKQSQEKKISCKVGIHGTFREFRWGNMRFCKHGIFMGARLSDTDNLKSEYGNKFASLNKIQAVRKCIDAFSM